MQDYNVTKDIVSRIDQLSKLLASTEKMTIYHGFKGGARIPFEEAEEQLAVISKTGAELHKDLIQYKDQENDEAHNNLINLCIMYANRLLENTEILKDITRKLKQSSDGGKKYGFFKLRKDTKEWERNTKKLIKVRSNVELLLENTPSG